MNVGDFFEWERNFVVEFTDEENKAYARDEKRRRANPSPSPCSVYMSCWYGEGKVGDVVVRGVCAVCGWPPDKHFELQRNLGMLETEISMRNYPERGV